MRRMDATAREVQARWRAWEAPYGDFIVHGDGSIVVMAPTMWSDSGSGPAVAGWSEVLRATAWTCQDWLHVDAVTASFAYDGYRALAGESSAHGSIGWVALTRDTADNAGTADTVQGVENELVWLAVSCTSNPFARVTLNATALTAASTSGRLWEFPRDAPEGVRISDDPQYPWPR